MGHTRLGTIPKSTKWSAVVASVLGGGDEPAGTRTLADDIQSVSDVTLRAAEAGLQNAIDDVGLQYSFYVLSQIVLSARTADWQQRLADLGIPLAPEANL